MLTLTDARREVRYFANHRLAQGALHSDPVGRAMLAARARPRWTQDLPADLRRRPAAVRALRAGHTKTPAALRSAVGGRGRGIAARRRRSCDRRPRSWLEPP